MKLSEITNTSTQSSRLKLSDVMVKTIQQDNRPIQNFPAERKDRFSIKASKPYESYSYIDALKDTGKTTINSLANLGESVRQPIQHPIQAIKAVGSAVVHPIKTIKDVGGYIKENYSSPEKIASKVSTDPFGYASDVISTGAVFKGIKDVSKSRMVENITENATNNKVYSLYNNSIGSKMRNVGDVNKVKTQTINAIKSINDNIPKIKLTNQITGELESRIPTNRLELLDALKQTKKIIWDESNSLSKGATAKSAQINLPQIVDDALKQTKKQIGDVALKTEPTLAKGLNSQANKIKSFNLTNPTQAEEYMKYLNNEVRRLRNSGQAVDYSVKDLYSNILNKLNDATDEAITKALNQPGYGQLRDKYSALKSREKEILNAANKYMAKEGGRGGGFVHPIVNLWSLEEVLESGGRMLVGDVVGAGSKLSKAAMIKGASKIVDYFRNPDKKIPEMFKILEKSKKYKSIKRIP